MQTNKLLPVKTDENDHPVICVQCNYVNGVSNNFCTNCGYPQQPGEDQLALYNTRIGQRNDFREACLKKIKLARNSLYTMATCCMLSIAYVIQGRRSEILTGIILFILAIMYVSLGKWTMKKPFTALLISLLLMLTFIAINVWAELASSLTSAAGIFVFILQVVLAYFLVNGVKAAFHVDILEEEFKA